MINFLKGELTSITDNPPRAVVLTPGGVGYLVSLPVFVRDSLQRGNVGPGEQVEFHIFYSVTERQPLPVLVGFQRSLDRAFFEQFVQVEGIGPTKAAAALVMPVSTVARAIELGDTSTLQEMPGIGGRAAQKIVATLKGKVGEAAMQQEDATDGIMVAPTARSQVVAVLVGLGYRNSDAIAFVDEAIARDPELADDEQRLLQEVFRSHPTATATAAG